MEREMKDYREFLCQNCLPIADELVSGEGCVICDINGKEYIDCCSQTLNLSLGQCNEKINKAVKRQIDKLTFASSRFGSDVQMELVKKIMSITPNSLNRINLKNTSGSSANENAIKAARKKHGKQRVISLMHSHHGQTHEMMRISGKHFDKAYLDKSDVFFADLPYCFRCEQSGADCQFKCLNSLFENVDLFKKDFCCMIIEPIMVDAGVIIPPKKYHEKIRELCDLCDIALIYDEIQTGFGWLGTFFAMDYYDVTPDIVTMGKGLGAGFPISACLMKEEYDVLTYGEHEITYGAHPVSLVSSIENIKYLENGGLDDVNEKSHYCKQRFWQLKENHACIGDIRGIGLLFGIEFVDDNNNPDSRVARYVYNQLLDNGILLRISKVGANSNILQFKPPLIISKDQIDKVMESIDFTLTELERLESNKKVVTRIQNSAISQISGA